MFALELSDEPCEMARGFVAVDVGETAQHVERVPKHVGLVIAQIVANVRQLLVHPQKLSERAKMVGKSRWGARAISYLAFRVTPSHQRTLRDR